MSNKKPYSASFASAYILLGLLATLVFVSGSSAQDGRLSGTLVVLNKSGHDASFIDLASGDTVATLATGRGPHELLVTRDGRWAITTDYSGGNSLTVFDVQNLRVARTIDLRRYARPHGIQFLPGEEEVVVTSEATDQLVIVNFMRGEIVRAIETGAGGSHMVAIAEDGSIAFTSNMSDDSVSVIDLASARVTAQLSVPERPEAITVNRAGTKVWVGSNDEGLVSVVDAASGRIEAQWEGFEWPYRILLTADERFAVMPDLARGSLRFFDVASKRELGEMSFPNMRPEGVVFLPDDRTLMLSLAETDEAVAIDIVNREILARYNTGSAPDGIAYSPLVLK